MRAGLLRHNVDVQKLVTQNDPEWGGVSEWRKFMCRWASVTPTAGREKVEADSVIAQSDYTVRIRYTDRITPEHRIVFRGQVLDILSIINVDNRNRELLIYCKVNHEHAS